MSWRFPAHIFAALALISFGASCTSVDRRHQVIISIPEQRMALLEDGAPLATYPVSTSKFGLGDIPGSSGTPWVRSRSRRRSAAARRAEPFSRIDAARARS